MVRTASVILRPVRRSDIRQLMDWRNDETIKTRTRGNHAITEEMQEGWWRRISSPESTDHMFIGWLGDVPIGCFGLCHWSRQDATAEISFYIGPQEYRGKGLATDALIQLHSWGFGYLKLERVFAEVYAFNEASLCLLARLGYTEEGRFRSHVERMGCRYDAILLGLLRKEWETWNIQYRKSSVSEMLSQA